MKRTSETNPGHTCTCVAQLSGQCTIVVEEIHEEVCNEFKTACADSGSTTCTERDILYSL